MSLENVLSLAALVFLARSVDEKTARLFTYASLALGFVWVTIKETARFVK